MAKSKYGSQKDKPVHLYPENHKIVKRIAFECDVAIEKIVNAILGKSLKDKETIRSVLLELEIDPKCLDEIL